MKNVGRRHDGGKRRRKIGRDNRRLFELRGRVVRGDGWGRTLGYPTANITRHYFHYHPVPNGVYVGTVKLGRRCLPSLAIIGVNNKVEIYILGWRKNIYGRYLVMEIVKKIRPLRSFSSSDKLMLQIKKDIITARHILRLKNF